MFRPLYTITPKIAYALMQIESARQAIADLPLTLKMLSSLRESARLQSTHYSTRIEGNRLTEEEVAQVIADGKSIPDRQRDKDEVRGYYTALDYVQQWAKGKEPLTGKKIQVLHAVVMGKGRKRVKPSPYRDGQNVIRESGTKNIVYLPPEAKDVPLLMRQLFTWLRQAETECLPCPLRAAIAHYQYATIHPYYDGNGRTARLLTTLLLHLGGYDMKGIYSLDEYYAEDLPSYYQALSIGPSHNYYIGRSDADITSWIEYFCKGMAESVQKIVQTAQRTARAKDKSKELLHLNARQRKVLALLQKKPEISAREIESALHLSARTIRALCQQWVGEGFLAIASRARKTRTYKLAAQKD